MKVFYQNKERCKEFLQAVMRSFELIAPVKTDLVRFEPITDVQKIHLTKNAYFPLKEYFFKKEELLMQFDGTTFVMPKLKSPKRVFFGIRRCDLNAIAHQDIVFTKDVHDPYYQSLRANVAFIGYHCNEAPSEYCFCGSLNLKDFYDLMYYDRGDHYLIEVGSEKGEMMIQKYKSYFAPRNQTISQEEKKIKNADRLKQTDISKLYEHPDWKKGVDQCLSCAACTNLCPTCYCFEIKDEVALDMKTADRTRQWSSCQLQEFTKVAGNHVFRQKREERFKHRIYHQLDYFKEKKGNNLCVGCGRCIEGCPTRIDFVEIINGMK